MRSALFAHSGTCLVSLTSTLIGHIIHARLIRNRPVEPLASSARRGGGGPSSVGSRGNRSMASAAPWLTTANLTAWLRRGGLCTEGLLPPSRSQLPNIFVRMARQPAQDVVQIGVGLNSQPLASNHQGKQIGRP